MHGSGPAYYIWRPAREKGRKAVAIREHGRTGSRPSGRGR